MANTNIKSAKLTMRQRLCELLDTLDDLEAVINSLLDAIPSPAQA